ncbi:MAG: hypothetical protein Q4B60_04450 [Erysipelotrichaceae bacterium]|nr:hypothetical protein [Erysipelotrichaceae bacterium]
MNEIVPAVYTALKIFKDNGMEGYLVGGAVRSYLLGTEIKDYDITTNAPPVTTKRLFANYPLYTIGEKHGTVVVTIDGVKIDITTYRSDVEYIDHRHPKEVVFSDNLLEDLKRRDFTINALCLNIDNKLIDEFNGLEDLNNKIIRAIGDPNTRFYEDALRILRALRFSSRLNFTIEEKTKEAMFKNKHLLEYISNERKKEELLYILATKNRYQTINEYLSIFNTFIPFKETDKKIDDFSNEYYALSYLLSSCEKVNLKELKFSRNEIFLIEALIEATNTDLKNDYNFISLLSDPLAKDILTYLEELYDIDYHKRYKLLSEYIITIDDLTISGNDLINMGYSGKHIGEIKKELLEKIHRKELRNDHSSLLKYLETK